MVNELMRLIAEHDSEVGAAVNAEFARQRRNLELIASENIVSEAVMAAMGTVLTNKYAEGYPGKRYYVAASAWTWWKTWPSSGQRSCLAVIMPTYSLIPARRQIWLCSSPC